MPEPRRKSQAAKPRHVPDPKLSVQFGAPSLVKVEFQRIKPELTEDDVAQASQGEFQLAVSRFTLERVGVQLTARSVDPSVIRFDATYGSLFEIQGGSEKTNYDEELKGIVAFVATATLYPFIREIVTSLAHRSGLPGFTLPLVNFRQVIDPQSISIPPVPEQDAETEEAPAAKGDPRRSG